LPFRLFAPCTFCPQEVSPLGRIQQYLVIQLKPSTIVWMLLTTHVTVIESQYVTVRICHAELKKLLTYLLGGETFLG